ncbi:MAG: M48 family metalloprotease [Myxococcales bacterium]|nr:M48 family metalloprotease [Myxococcales bacterium]
MNAHDVRSEADVRLSKKLAEDPLIRQAIRARDEEERDTSLGIRRSLLAQALRLTKEVAPTKYAVVDRCKERLGVDEEVEMYVYASADYNAAMPRGEGDRTFVLVSSSLYEALDDEELSYVIGHELGHHVYDHHALPLYMLEGPGVPVSPTLALEMFTWQRYAEISADRAGLLCCNGLQPAARALFKLSSGLRTAPTPQRIAAFLQQADELYREVEQTETPIAHRDWLSTHPFSPVRLKAAEAFVDSEVFTEGGRSMANLEMHVTDLMGLMEPGYMDEDTEEAEHMRRVMFAAGVQVAAASGDVSEAEIEALKGILGDKNVPETIAPQALAEDLPRRIEAANTHVRGGRRAQLVRDLTVVARADGKIDEAEIGVIRTVAAQLKVDPSIVESSLHAQAALD